MTRARTTSARGRCGGDTSWCVAPLVVALALASMTACKGPTGRKAQKKTAQTPPFTVPKTEVPKVRSGSPEAVVLAHLLKRQEQRIEQYKAQVKANQAAIAKQVKEARLARAAEHGLQVKGPVFKMDARVNTPGSDVVIRKLRFLTSPSLSTLPELKLVRWGDFGERRTRYEHCVVISGRVTCQGDEKVGDLLGLVVKRLKLGARSKQISEADWAALVPFLKRLYPFAAKPAGQNWKSLIESFPWAPKALLAQLHRRRVDRLRGGGVRVELHHRVFGDAIRAERATATIGADDSVQYQSVLVHYDLKPPKAVLGALLAHLGLKSVQEAEAKHLLLRMALSQVPVAGLYMVKESSSQRRFFCTRDAVKEAPEQWASPQGALFNAGRHDGKWRSPEQDKLLTWVVQQVQLAKVFKTLKWDHWDLLIRWAYGSYPGTRDSWLGGWVKHPEFDKHYHAPRVTQLPGGGIQLQYLQAHFGLIQTTLQLRVGKPVVATHHLLIKEPRDPKP